MRQFRPNPKFREFDTARLGKNRWLPTGNFGRRQALIMHNYHIYADKYVTRDVITPYASVTNTTMSVISKVTKNAACE